MSESRYLHCLYAEDVRQELSNQLSIIGVFQGGLGVPSAPSQISKLAIVADLFFPNHHLPKSVRLEVLRDDEVMQTIEPPKSFIAEAMKQVASDDDRMGYNMQLILGFSGFPITKSCKVRVRAIVDGETIRGNPLRIEVASAPESPPKADTESAPTQAT